MDLEKIEFAPRTKGPVGFGGWLILPLVGLAFTSMFAAITLFRDVMPIFTGPAWAALTTPGSTAFNAHWATYITASLVANLVLLVGSSALLTLAFRRSSRFPPAMIVFYLVIVPLSAIDLWAYSTFLGDIAQVTDRDGLPDGIRGFARAVVACLVWIPYFLSSKRVQNTFTR